MYLFGRDLLNCLPPSSNAPLPISSGSKLLSQPPDGSDYADYVCANRNQSLDELHSIYIEEKSLKPNLSISGEWLPHIARVEVKRNLRGSGSVWNRVVGTLGYSLNGRHFLYPEEALFLCECCVLHLLHHNVVLSIQQAFNCLLDVKVSDCTLSNYLVYSSLARIGYVIHRYHAAIHKSQYQLNADLSREALTKPDVDNLITHSEPSKPLIIEINLKNYNLYSLDLASNDRLSWHQNPSFEKCTSSEDVARAIHNGMSSKDALVSLQERTVLNFDNNFDNSDRPIYNVYSQHKSEFSKRRKCKPLFTVFIKLFYDLSFSCPLKLSQKSQEYGHILIAVVDNGQVNFYQLDCNNCPTLVYNLPEPE